MCSKVVEQCPRCDSDDRVKSGFDKGRQRYKCKGCSFHYTVTHKSDVRPLATRKLALQMYLEGLGFRAIGRILKVSNVTVLNWVKAFGAQAAEIQSEQEVEVMELDELHSYVGNKKTTAGYGLLLIDMVRSSSILCVAPEGLRQGGG